MTTIVLNDEAAGISAYEPEASVKRTDSASTSEPNARPPSTFKFRSKYGLPREARPGSHSATYTFEDQNRVSPPDALASEFYEKFEDRVSPLDALASEFYAKQETTCQATEAYRERIDTFMSDAVSGDVPMNKSSERQFWTFLGSQGFFKKGALFLLNNGNLRAAWKNETGDQIGLQFPGNEIIQYVMFKHRHPGTENISRVAGRDTLSGICRQIAALDLSHLISA